MLVLGKNPNEKGEQLETLTLDLLNSLSYVNCSANVMTGGAEIDVKGQFALPGPAGTRFQSLICECKAHRTVVDMTQWNKFLGKVFFQEASEGQDVNGCFLALSGVNGHVRGNYDELRQHRQTVSLVHGDDLLVAIARLCPFSLPQALSELTHRLTQRVVMRYEAAYYNKAIYWVIVFDQGDFTVLSGFGAPLDQAMASTLVPMIQVEIEAQNYIDLQVEATTQRRAARAKSAALGTLFELGGSVEDIATLTENRMDSTANDNEPFSADDVRKAVHALIEDGIVVTDGSTGRCYIPTSEREGEVLVSPEVYRVLLVGGCRVSVLGCRFYDEHINLALLREICKIQADLPPETNQLDKVISLLRLSPTALATALHPIQMVMGKGSRRGIDTNVDRCHRDIFLQVLSDSFNSDFSNPVLREYYYECRKIREVETRSEIKVKSDTAIILEHNVTERVAIARAAQDLGGGFVRVVLLNTVPDPWEPFWNAQRSAGDNPEHAKEADCS